MGVQIAQVVTADIALRYLLFNQIRALQEAGYEVTGVCADGPHVEPLRRMGCPVDVVPIERELSPLKDVRAFYALYRYFKSKRFDVVITHTPKAGLLGPLAAQIAGVPLVIHTVHGFLFHDRMPPMRYLAGIVAEALTALGADYLFFQSLEDLQTAQRLRFKSGGRVFYVGNGVDTSRFSPNGFRDTRDKLRTDLKISSKMFVVGTVGRLVREKGYGELFQAASILSRRYSDMLFLVIGPGEPGQRDAFTHRDLKRLGASSAIRFLGHRDDLPCLYGAMDVFVLASHREGIPRALMEASAMELPVIASDIRGCREVVIHGKTGLLFPLKDAQALATAIEEIYKNRQVGLGLGRAGRLLMVEKFDERLVCERIATKLAELLSKNSSQ